MKNKIKKLVLTLAIIAAPIIGIALPQVANAADTPAATGATGGSGGSGINVFSNCGNGSGVSSTTSGAQICGASQQDDFKKLVQNIINLMLVVIGMVSVIAIIIGGIRYTTSNGEPAQIKSAKDTILYAVVGLVIAIMAYAIVNFIIASIKK